MTTPATPGTWIDLVIAAYVEALLELLEITEAVA